MTLSSKLHLIQAAVILIYLSVLHQPSIAAECDIYVLGDCTRALIPDRAAAVVRATESISEAITKPKPAQRRAAPSTRNASTQSQRLSSSARCLEGTWALQAEPIGSNDFTVNISINKGGSVYFDGMSMAQNPNAALLMNNNVLDLSYREPAGTMTLRAKLEGETLVGPMTMTKIERGTLQPPITLNLRGTRLTAAPNGCELKAVIPSAQTRERGSSIADGLSNLSKLYSEGLLTDEEFSAAKRRLLGL